MEHPNVLCNVIVSLRKYLPGMTQPVRLDAIYPHSRAERDMTDRFIATVTIPPESARKHARHTSPSLNKPSETCHYCINISQLTSAAPVSQAERKQWFFCWEVSSGWSAPAAQRQAATCLLASNHRVRGGCMNAALWCMRTDCPLKYDISLCRCIDCLCNSSDDTPTQVEEKEEKHWITECGLWSGKRKT